MFNVIKTIMQKNGVALRYQAGSRVQLTNGLRTLNNTYTNTQLETKLNAVGWEYNILADSAARTGTTEAVFSNGSWTIAADRPVAGSVIEFEAIVRCTGQNGTDTQTFAVRLGGVSGTVIASTGALDIGNGEFAVIKGKIQIRTAGGSGTLVAHSEVGLSTAGLGLVALGSTAVATNASLALVVTADASSAHAGNTSVLQEFRARIAA